MKVLYTIFGLLIFLSSAAFSQTYESFTAKDGYNYLVTSGITTNMKLVQMMAMETKDLEMLSADVPAGTATNWTFSMVSNNPANKTLYSWILLKMAGEFIAIPDSVPENEDTFDNPLNSINWVNSDVIGKNFKNSGSGYEFYSKNEDLLAYKYLICQYTSINDTVSDYLWIVAFTTNGTDGGACVYSAKTGNLITCEIGGVGITETQKMIENHFPNPANGNIHFQTNYVGSAKIEIYDLNGALVKEINTEINNDFQLNVSELNNGVYNVLITTSTEKLSRKIVISR